MKLTTTVLLLSLFLQPIQSQEIPKNRTWPNLANFSKGTDVRIQLLQPRTKLKGKIRQYTPLIGALAGAVTLGLIVAQPNRERNLVPSAVVVMAGIGVLIGFGLGMPVRYQIVYQSR